MCFVWNAEELCLNFSTDDVSKKLGEEWRALSNEEKAQYGARAAAEGKLYEELKAHHEAKAAADKKRYEEEMAIYEAKEAADKKRDEDDQKATSTAVRIIAGFMDEWKAANTPVSIIAGVVMT